MAVFGYWPGALQGRGALAAGLAAASFLVETQPLLVLLPNCPAGDRHGQQLCASPSDD